MSTKFVNCPYCHKTVVKGAMRCVGCGKILQTPEEQIAAIEKLQTKKKFNIKKFLNFTVILVILGVVYYHFSEKLIEILKKHIGI